MKKEIKSEMAPKAIGPYSQATLENGILYVSGQLPIDPATGEFPGDDIREQTRMSLKNIEAILKEAEMDFNDVMKTMVLLADIQDFGAMNEVYNEFFKAPYPARAAFQVAALPKNAKVEIELVAAKYQKK